MAKKPTPLLSPTGGTTRGGPLPAGVVTGFDRVMAIQRPVVLAHIRSIRRRHPEASPEQIWPRSPAVAPPWVPRL
jgi:hypothetical protein